MSLPSRISSEWRTAQLRRGFRLRLVAVIGILALACAALAAAAVLQGPRLQSVRADPAALVAGPGGVVELLFPRPIAAPSPEAVSIEPDAPVEVDSVGSSVVLRFLRALDAGTSYRLVVDGVAPQSGGPASRVETRIETPPLTVTTLVRGAGAAEIVETTLDGSEPRVIHREAGIREFARLDGTVLVVRDLDSRRSVLELSALDGVATQSFPLPDEGRIENLGVVDTVVLFTHTSAEAAPTPQYDLALFRSDLAGDAIPTPVLGLDGQPLAIFSWFRLPGTNEVLLAARDGMVLRYAPSAAAPPLPIGQFSQVYGVTPDGTGIVAADPFGPVLLELATGAETRLTPSLIDGFEPYVGEVAAVAGSLRVAKVALPDETGGFATSLVLDDGTASEPVLLPGAEGASVAEFRASPSGQYLVVVLDRSAPGEAVTGPTLVLELASGRLVAQLRGVAPAW